MSKPRTPRRLRVATQYGILLLLYAACSLLAATVLSLFLDDPNEYVGLGLLAGGFLLVGLLRLLRGRTGPGR